MTRSQPPSAVGRLTFLPEEARRAIFDTALDVIGQVGMRVLHPEALALLRNAGAEIAGDDRVRLPRRLVSDALASVPHSFPMYDRVGEPAFELGGYTSVFGTGSDLMRLFDLETGGGRRTSVLADVGRAAQALPTRSTTSTASCRARTRAMSTLTSPTSRASARCWPTLASRSS